jgi:hypothetical protein
METEKDLIYWVPSFYVLEDLLIRFSPTEVSPSRVRLRDDICEARKNYSKLLSQLFFDVLVKMCFGEARHAHDRCGIVIPEIDSTLDRNAVYKLSEQFDPKASLPKLRDLFLECWLQPYGGSAWAIICETAMKFWSLPHEIFIDYCVDLSHHGGLAFDKIETGFHVWHKRRYLDILDLKRNGSILDIDGPLPVFHFVEALLLRADNLNIIDAAPKLMTSRNFGYRPVQWGKAVLSDAQSLDSQKRPVDLKEEEIVECVCEGR